MAQFVDTNIWIYAHLIGTDDDRSEAARRLLAELDDAVVSTQVLAEYSAVMIRNHLPDRQVRENLMGIVAMCRVQPVETATVIRAWEVRERYGFSFWDSQMVAAALQAGCNRLYTEDLQHGQEIEHRLSVLNPFPA